MQKKNNFLSNIGLCARAGGCVWGSESCVDGVRGKKIHILFVDEAASENTKKRFSNACNFHSVPMYLFDASQWDIARAIGRPEIKVLGVTRDSWVKPLHEQIAQFNIAVLNQGGTEI